MMQLTREPTIAERLVEPRLVKRLCKSLLNRGVPSRAIDDVVQQARVEVWRLFEREPHGVDEIAPLFFARAWLRAIDWMRRNKREALREDYEELRDGRCTEDVAPIRDALDDIERDAANDAQLAQALDDIRAKVVGGESFELIAERRGVDPARVRKGVFRLREYASEHWDDYRVLIAIAVVALIFALARRPPQETTAVDVEPRPAPLSTAIALPKKLPEPRAEPTAQELRIMAQQACRAGRYGECLEELGRARELDRAGDAEPGVRALWEAARRGMAKERTPYGDEK